MMAFLAKGYSLFSLTVLESTLPFVRMMILSRALPLRELGFVSALTATLSTFEQMTDFAIYRFLFSVRREKYEEALASAHTLSVLRGVVVGSLAVAAGPLIARGLSLSENWLDFSLLGLVIFIRSFDHLAPRVAERDYRYGVQLKVSGIAYAAGLTTLLAGLLITRSHVAFLASIIVQSIAQITASHSLADTPYRLKIRSPLLIQAFRFGYPLMFNGMGLAATAQGDRFIVGALLGLPALGVYAVATIAAYVPMGMLSRLTGTFLLAALYNASHLTNGVYEARVRFAARAVPIAAGLYALGIVTLMNVVVPLVFGRQFHLSREAVALLAVACFFRIVRGDPFTSMLTHEGRTRRLAVANLCSTSALLFELALILIFNTFESVFAGRLLGEAVGLGAILFVTLGHFRRALQDWIGSATFSLAVVGGAIALSFTTSVGDQPIASFMTLIGCFAIFALYAARYALPHFRSAFPGKLLVSGDRAAAGDAATKSVEV